MEETRLSVGDLVRIAPTNVFVEQEARILAIKRSQQSAKVFYILDTHTRNGKSYPAAFERHEIQRATTREEVEHE